MKGKDLTVRKERKSVKDMTPAEFSRAKSDGKLCYHPVVKDGKLSTNDGQNYDVINKGGTIVNACKPPRMSKKARRLWRKEQLAQDCQGQCAGDHNGPCGVPEEAMPCCQEEALNGGQAV